MFVEAAEVTGMEPAVLVNHFGSQFWLFIIAHHNVMTAANNLIFFSNPHLHAGEREAYIAYFAAIFVVTCAYGDNGRSLCKTVAFNNGDSHCAEEPVDFLMNSGGSRHYDIKIVCANLLTYLAIHKFVSNFQFQVIPH